MGQALRTLQQQPPGQTGEQQGPAMNQLLLQLQRQMQQQRLQQQRQEQQIQQQQQQIQQLLQLQQQQQQASLGLPLTEAQQQLLAQAAEKPHLVQVALALNDLSILGPTPPVTFLDALLFLSTWAAWVGWWTVIVKIFYRQTFKRKLILLLGWAPALLLILLQAFLPGFFLSQRLKRLGFEWCFLLEWLRRMHPFVPILSQRRRYSQEGAGSRITPLTEAGDVQEEV